MSRGLLRRTLLWGGLGSLGGLALLGVGSVAYCSGRDARRAEAAEAAGRLAEALPEVFEPRRLAPHWPEPADPERLAALALARAEPARMVKGDAVKEISGLIAGQPAEALACVSHSIMLYQLPEPQRAAFADRLKAASLQRPVLRAAFEGHRGSEYPVVSATLYRGGAVVWHRDLAKGNPHGRWLSML